MAVSYKFSQGNEWSPSGIGSGSTGTIYTTVTQPLTVDEDVDTLKVWFAGLGGGTMSGVVTSAYLTQGTKSIPIRVHGQYMDFVIPPSGCWSDILNVSDFTLPGEVNVVTNYDVAASLPTFSDNTNPSDPVVVSSIYGNPPGGVYLDEKFSVIANYIPINSYAGTYRFDTGNWSAWREGDYELLVSDGLTIGAGPEVGNVSVSKDFVSAVAPSTVSVQFEATMTKLAVSSDIYGLVGFYAAVCGHKILFRADGIHFRPSGYSVIAERIADIPSGSSVYKVIFGDCLFELYIDGTLVYHNDYYFGVPTLTSTVGFSAVSNETVVPGCGEVSATIGYIIAQKGNDAIQIQSSNLLQETPQEGTVSFSTFFKPTNGTTFTISNSSTTVFTFVNYYPLKTTEVQIGASNAITLSNLAAAINRLPGAEFVAEVNGSEMTVKAYTNTDFVMTTTVPFSTIGTTNETIDGLITENATVADEFTVSMDWRFAAEAASAADATDGLIDGMAESASVSTTFDSLFEAMDETASATALSDNFDGLIDYMGEEI